ncbi:ABC transporter substrate-binding protein, partial [Amycolatopsis sp. H6(2020)]|nr:ABC transporter substrate-binding protein [Amycolatopsis sp. H6(2020)]
TKMEDDGTWKKDLDEATKGANFHYNEKLNPPKPDSSCA